ncbi:MAG: hypothetical protein OXR72_12435 [Gemmatimonadota bacterium]|nr:hypothetical protein [Gemmatimonadota bacterium]
MIRALSTTCLAVGFALAAIQCLCGVSVQAEACHAQPVEADCCCAGNGGSVKDAPQELPSAIQSSTPRFPGPDSHIAPPSVRSPASFLSRLPRTVVYQSVASRQMSSLYLMNASFLI